ncbi:MAG: DUF1641 domain-containing protein [Firmicutes bacterium]|nr:DUF1641 domain-containing protein [Bacillota bacterium]
MAKALATRGRLPAEKRQQLQWEHTQEDLKAQLIAHKEALDQLFALLDQLAESDLLQAMAALLGARKELLAILAKRFLPTTVHTVQDAEEVWRWLDALPPTHLQQLFSGVQAGALQAEQVMHSSQSLRLFALVRMVRDPDINRALRGMFAFLKGMGQALARSSEDTGEAETSSPESEQDGVTGR